MPLRDLPSTVINFLTGNTKPRLKGKLAPYSGNALVIDVHNFYHDQTLEGRIVGQIIKGELRASHDIKIMPATKTVRVDYIEVDKQRVTWAWEGQLVTIGVSGVSTEDVGAESVVVNAEAEQSKM